ncbi:M28 family peptidase [Micromonospora zhanjiangensis]|uniref:M28 family peptidase n=1 Tax=Micromonospora zhanjiangensis TaxID=1522057 RepID=A0ABV8KHF1_9ACTN
MATPEEPPADRALIRPRHRRWSAVAAVAALLAVAVGALVNLQNPAPRAADADPGRFSAGRAYRHVQTIAAQAHVAGSPAADRVRGYLVDTLRGLGLQTEVQDTVADEAGQLSGAAGGSTLGHVRNVVARLPGSAPTGRVFVVAHYDSVQTGPGGNDDAAGTSAILEVARALTTGPRPRNDIVFVLTDAEEACLCGASAFAASHPLAAQGGVVLNLEARGSTGPVIMFETSRRNAKLVDLFAGAAPHPVGTSFAVEVYRLLPNDTDFTAFQAKGFVGLNSAYIDGGAVYHTPLDTPAAMDRSSLQAHGDNALGLARAFGATDIPALAAGGDATYFPVPGGLVRYPAWLVWPLALLAVVAVAALAWLARRRDRTSWPRLAAGFALTLVPLAGAPLAAQLFWWGVTTVRPGYRELLDPYRPLWYRLAVGALAAAVLLTWYALTRRRTGPAALAIGALGWLAGLGVLLAGLAPGGAYLATLPALAGALGGLLALTVRPGRWWALAGPTAAAAVAVLILLPTVTLLFPALGMAQGGAAALFAVLLGLAALPVLELLFPVAGGQLGLAAWRARRAATLPPLVAALAAVVFAALGLSTDRFDAAHPAPTQLMYALDAGTGTARWVSQEDDPQPWTAQYVHDRGSVEADFPALGPRPMRYGPAQAAALPAPTVQVLADTRAGDRRTLRVELVPQRSGVRLVSLHVDAGTAEVRAVTVAGHPVPDTAAGPARPWSYGIVLHAPPPGGVEIELVLAPKAEKVALRAMDASDGLTGLPGFRPRPADVGVAGSHTSEMLAVARTYTF